MASINRAPGDFAILGGPAAFHSPIPVAQLYFPSWDRYRREMEAIFEREYYTNHGPNVEALEQRLEETLHVRNALTVTNATVGLYLVALALDLRGPVVVPAWTFAASPQAMTWAGLDVTFCDVDPTTQHISPNNVEAALELAAEDEQPVAAILGVNLWGGSCDPEQLARWVEARGITLFFDSAQALGCTTSSGPIGGFGRAEVFSFHATKIVSATEGGCICTNDDALAEDMRNMRSNYGIRSPREVPLIINGRMSEAQAAVALLSLDDLEESRERNRELWAHYVAVASDVPGLTIRKPSDVLTSNFQYLVCEVDPEFGLSRDRLLAVLRAEGVLARRYFHPGLHRVPPYSAPPHRVVSSLPNTEKLASRVMQLPIGALIDREGIDILAQILRDAHREAGVLARKLALQEDQGVA